MDSGHALLYLIIIIASAKIGGEIAEHFKQPAVLGELLVGVLLSMTAVREAASNSAIVFVGSIGIILLLFEVGLESELSDYVKVGSSAILVAVVGVIMPLAMGTTVSYILRGDIHQALFLGATLTATSVGITTRVLADMGKIRMKESKIIIGAAVVDDVLGLLLLSVVLQIVSVGRLDVFALVKAVVIALVFLIGSIWLGRRCAPKLISFAQQLKTRGVLVSISFLFCLILAFFAEKLGLAGIIGAFAAGLVLAATDDRVNIHRQIKPVTDIFVPVFFVLVGLQVDLRSMNPLDASHRSALLVFLILLFIAVVGKLMAGFGVLAKNVSKYAVGVGMIPRGEVGLIFASMGLKDGIVPVNLYGELILIVFISTLITPFWLRRVFTHNVKRMD